jgi:mono/diheme cytochrome c family protein
VRRLALVLGAALALAACEQGPALSPAAERGRQVYLANCVACHGSDPAQRGPVGPPVKGSARALLEAKVLRGGYPPGHAPKQNSTVMQPLPHLAPSIDDLAAFLQ